MRRIASLALAAILTLTLATSALAGTSTSVQTVSATVVGTISMTGIPGIPATLAFSGTAGSNVVAPTFTITVASSDAFTVKLSASALSGPGPDIAPERYYVKTNGAEVAYSGPDMLIGSTSPLVEILKLAIPSGQAAGVYSGTLTWTASN